MPSRTIDIIVAGPQPIFLCGLITTLGNEQGVKVIGSCNDRVTCVQAIRDLLPRLALVDSCLPDQGTIQVLAAIRSEKLSTRVIVLSGPNDPPSMSELVREGAYCVLSKEVSAEALVRCLRDADCGRGSSLLPAKSLNGHSPPTRGPGGDPSTVLTERERQITQLVCEGLSNKDIGRELKLSDGTVKVHLHHIYKKLAIRNRTALALSAARNAHGLGPKQKATDLEILPP